MTSECVLSVVMTANNIEGQVASLMKSVKLPCSQVEYIFVDRSSDDRTLFEASRIMGSLGVKSITIQNGFGPAATAFNTGLFRASGRYVSFVTPRVYNEQVVGLTRTALEKETGYDLVVPVHPAQLEQPQEVTGQQALERLVGRNGVPPFGSALFSREFLRRKELSLTDNPQMAGLGLELTIKALAQAGVVLLVPMRAGEIGIRKETVIRNRMEFSCFMRIDAVLRAIDEVRHMSGIRPAIVEKLLRYYIPQKLLECIDELLESGLSYSAIAGYIHTQDYTRFMTRQNIGEPALRKKLLLWRRMPWLYARQQNREYT